MTKKQSNGRGRIRRAASSVGNTMKRVASKLHLSRARNPVEATVEATGEATGEATARRTFDMAQKSPQASAASRPKRVDTEIPLETIAEMYTPSQAASKEGFRSDGHDRQADQEYARGIADERFNAEDVLTNKSGDPRIGTHHRTYEPGERERDRTR